MSDKPPTPLPLLIAILATGGFASTFAGRCMEPLVGTIARDFAADPKTIALIAGVYALPYALVQPVLGPIGDALGKAKIMRGGLVLLCLALLASAAATSVPLLFALRILAGAAAGGVIPLALAVIGDRVPIEGRQLAISRFIMAVILGQLAGSVFAGVMEQVVGWRGVLLVAAAIAGLAAALTLRLRRFTRAVPLSFGSAVARYREILSIPFARALITLVFVEAVAIFGLFPFVAPIIEARGLGGALEAGFALGGFALGGLAYTLAVPLLLRTLGVPRMVLTGGVISAVALVGFGFAPSWPAKAMALAGLGLGFYLLHNSFQTQITEVAPQSRASAVALHAFAFFCGQALGVILFSFGLGVAGETGTLAANAVLILGVGLVASAIIGRALRPPPLPLP
jgi:predicted MFS family arabinose efflux permease